MIAKEAHVKGIDFLSGGGELGELLRSFDWANNPLGRPDKWPNSLKTIVRIMLTSQQPIWIGWGKDLIKLYNDPYKAIVGGKHPWALGQPASVVWEDIWNDIEPMLTHVMSENEGTYVESHRLIMERNGYPEETYYTFSYSPVPDDDGNIGGMFCANTDDTQRIIGERQLALLRDLSSRLLNVKTIEEVFSQSALALATNSVDAPFSMIYTLEDPATLMLAGTTGIWSGHDAAPAVAHLNTKTFWPFEEVLEQGGTVVVSDLKNTFKDLPTGSWHVSPDHAVLVPISQSGHSAHAGVLVVGLNPFRLFNEDYKGFINLVAGQIAASVANVISYQEQRKRAEALAEIDKAKTVFFSNVSHELRTPLTLILGPIEDALRDPATSPAERERLTLAHRNSIRLLKLVNTLLDFSRIEAGKMQALFKKTDICEFIKNIAVLFVPAMQRAGLRFNVNCRQPQDEVYLDHSMFERIAFNLLSNALKYTIQGEITISVQQVNNQIELIVRDTGTGIPVDELPKLFSRFHRIEGAKGRTHEGTGIGLAMVQELVKLHGGVITVESELGKGSAFKVSIPTGKLHLPPANIATDGHAEKITLNALPDIEEELTGFGIDPSPAFENEASHPTTKDTILVVDDNADMRDYISKLLHPQYDIVLAKDGLDAIRVIEGHRPTLILSDIMMPNLDGLGLLKYLRENERFNTLPIIFLSARAGEEARVEGVVAGADDYLVKPFSARELLAKVSSQIKLAKTRSEAERKLSNLFLQAPAAIVMLSGPDFVIQLANPITLKLWGRKAEEVANKPLFEALPEVRGQGVEELLQNVYETGIPFFGSEIPVRIDRNGDGILEDVYFTFIYTQTKDADGRVEGVMVFANDVTDQVKSRRAVEEQNRVLEMITSGAPLGEALTFLIESIERQVDHKLIGSVLLTDDEGRHLYHGAAPGLPLEYNQAIDGIAIGPAVGSCGTAAYLKMPVIVNDIQTDPRWENYKDLAARHGLRSCWSTPILAGEKLLGTFAMYSREIATPSEELRKVIGFATRTAMLAIERTRFEQALRESEAKFRRFYDSNMIPINFWNIDGAIYECNEAFAKLVGYSKAEIAGGQLNWRNITPDEHLHVYERTIRRAIEDKSFVDPHEAVLIRKDGERINVIVGYAMLEGSNDSGVAFIMDITEHKQLLTELENRVQDRTRELQASNEDLQQFAHVASHDLKEPVRKIKTFATRLLDTAAEKMTDKERAYVNKIVSATDRMTTMIEGVLTYSTINAAEQAVEAIDLNQIIGDIKNDLEVVIQHKQAIIKTDNLPVVDGGGVLLYQLFYNLINNSLKFTRNEERPVISITSRPVLKDAVAYAEITVADNGIGFEPRYAEKIFDTFTRLNSKDVFDGTGLGLALCKNIVERHGGQITARGEKGTGATFTIILPMKQLSGKIDKYSQHV